MPLITKAPRGTADKLPGEIHKLQAVEKTCRETAYTYGFKEIRTPVFEHTELFQRSVGGTTDIVQKEMYTFNDKKGRSLTLKPEGTAGAARAAIENGLLNDALPIKLYYLTNCYRYEAPQSGRYREFTQFGAEVFGAAHPLCDAELLALTSDIFKKLNIADYTLEINSIGCPCCRENYQKALREYFGQYSDRLCRDCAERLQRNPMRLLDCKNPDCAALKKDAPLILAYNCPDCADYFNSVKKSLDSLKIEYTVNEKIVRGLDYYTNTVFEFIDKKGLVFGAGGRYNGLIKELGGADIPGAGFALGLERIISVMEDGGGFDKVTAPAPDVYIAGIGAQANLYALGLAKRLRASGVWAECDLTGRSVKKQMRYADKIGAKTCVVIGDDELESGKASLKEMKTGGSSEVVLNDIDFSFFL